MSEFKPVVSSNVEAAKYDAAMQELVVKFKNGTSYKYFNFPENLYQEWERTFDGKNGSAGSFFHLHIRSFECVKLEGENEA